jgi:cell division inhibitor SepF
MAKFVDYVKNLVSPSAPYEDDEYYGDEYYDDEEFEEPEPQPRSYTPKPRRSSAPSHKVVSINTSVSMQVAVVYPMSIEDAADVCKDLKERKTVVVNLEKTDAEVAQRISDFLCGAGYALEGSIQSISDEIFIICPANVKLTGEFKQELAANGIKIPSAALWR